MEEKELINDKNELDTEVDNAASPPEESVVDAAEIPDEVTPDTTELSEELSLLPDIDGCDAENTTELSELSLDSESTEDATESAEENAEYESFFAEYSTLMAERIKAAVKGNADDLSENSEQTADSADADVIILGEDIEFHSDIVEKAERKNAEDHIKLVSEKAEPEELPPDNEEHADEECESAADTAEAEAIDDAEERHIPEPEQMEIDFSPKPTEKKQDKTVYDEKNPRVIDYVFDALEMIAITLLAAIVITSIFFRFSFVDGHSMDKTLANGDTLLISDLFYTPDYNDIVVIEYETNVGEKKPLIKRVIGLEGDKILITVNGEVYRNGELLDESSYVYLDGPIPVTLAGEWKVGEDEIFVMGDHRNDSKDSRDIGPVSTDAVIGRAIIRIFPLASFGTVD